MKEREETAEQPPKKMLDPEKFKQALKASLALVKKMGIGAVDLLKKLKKDKSPEALLHTIEEALSANRQKRESLSGRAEELYVQIVEKKKAHAAASPARKRILEHELAALLAHHRAAERELVVLLENERVLSEVKGRIMEIASYGMAGVSEAQIDELIDDVEEAVGAAEGRLDATRDLERAGRRKERASEREALFEALDAFEEPASAASSPRPEQAAEEDRSVTSSSAREKEGERDPEQ